MRHERGGVAKREGRRGPVDLASKAKTTQVTKIDPKKTPRQKKMEEKKRAEQKVKVPEKTGEG